MIMKASHRAVMACSESLLSFFYYLFELFFCKFQDFCIHTEKNLEIWIAIQKSFFSPYV